MKKKYCFALILLFSAAFSQASMIVGSWTPLFKGIDHAVGTNFADVTIPRLQVVHCVRVDLTDPDVQVFSTPPASNYVSSYSETYALSVSNFLKIYGLKVAADANFYSGNPGASDPSTEGIPCQVYGLQICTGAVVSTPDLNNRYCSILFTTNNFPYLALNNTPPGTNTAGIYTAITGYYPILLNGVNVGGNASVNYPDAYVHQAQPRTVYGFSQDRHYMYLMTIDGRQGGYSDGATDIESGIWMLQFGGYDAINMDGGGSTAMYMADCAGNPLPVNHSSYVLTGRGHERFVGSHFGVFAKPISTGVTNMAVAAGATTVTINWTTPTASSSQVAYGLTTNYGTFSSLDPTPVTNHTVQLSGLSPAKTYYFRVLSQSGLDSYTADSCFFTTNNLVSATVFGLTNTWKYTSENLDGVNWQGSSYSDAAWPSGRGLLYIEDNVAINPKNTLLPLDPSTSYPYTNYYFRTHFNFSNDPGGVTLTFSNYLDDGAVYYLNGVEIRRAFMPPAPAVILNSTLATGTACASGDADCPYVFTMPGSSANLSQGDNVLAVEVHNFNGRSPDIVFGLALLYLYAPSGGPFVTNVVALPADTKATISWTTLSNSTSQVEYGLTPSYGTTSALGSELVTNHSVTITGLQPETTYYFRVISTFGGVKYFGIGTFTTLPFYRSLLDLTNSWRFTTNNLDGVNWTAFAYNDSNWAGSGPALLYVGENPDVNPKNTLLPTGPGNLPPTYYFRTHFLVTNGYSGLALVFSNFVDDGAVFYLNGKEIQRLRMPAAPQPISYTNLATTTPPFGDALYPDIFRIGGNLLTNLIVGDNVLAAEVHQNIATSIDVTFGSSVGFARASVAETKLRIASTNSSVCISWDGSGFTLQQNTDPGKTNLWSDVPGTASTSMYCPGNLPSAMFYRLRN